MHQLWRHSNGIWYVRHGKRLRKRVTTRTRDRGQAEIFLSRFIAAQDSIGPANPTIAAILSGYEADKGQRVRSKETLRLGCVSLKRHLGNLLPQQITPGVMRRYVTERRVAAGSVLREAGILRAALSWAVEHQWITKAAKPEISNPVPTPQPRDRWITRDEARRLLAACHMPHVRLFVMLGIMTAARHGAILELKWAQVNLDQLVIDYGRGHGNKRRAVVPINAELEQALKAGKALACSEFVIEYRGEPLKSIKNGFQLACRRAGLKGVTAHVLRHSAATWMAMDAVPMREIARLLGDREATVDRVYAKHSPSYLRRAANAVRLGLNGAEFEAT